MKKTNTLDPDSSRYKNIDMTKGKTYSTPKSVVLDRHRIETCSCPSKIFDDKQSLQVRNPHNKGLKQTQDESVPTRRCVLLFVFGISVFVALVHLHILNSKFSEFLIIVWIRVLPFLIQHFKTRKETTSESINAEKYKNIDQFVINCKDEESSADSSTVPLGVQESSPFQEDHDSDVLYNVTEGFHSRKTSVGQNHKDDNDNVYRIGPEKTEQKQIYDTNTTEKFETIYTISEQKHLDDDKNVTEENDSININTELKQVEGEEDDDHEYDDNDKDIDSVIEATHTIDTNTELKQVEANDDNNEDDNISSEGTDANIRDTKQKRIDDDNDNDVEYIYEYNHDKIVPKDEDVRNLENLGVSSRTDIISYLTRTYFKARLVPDLPGGRVFQSDGSKRGESKKLLSAYETSFHRHLEPSLAQPKGSDARDYAKVIRDLTYKSPASIIASVKDASVYMLSVNKQSSISPTDTTQRISSVEQDGRGTATSLVVTETPIPSTETSIPAQQSENGATVNRKVDVNNIDDVLRETALGRDPGPRVTMKFELLRLCTLRNYPKENKPYISRLAAAGFYYAAERDEVVCYCCAVRRSDWTADCDPMATHRRLSPTCPFLTRNAAVNIPVPEDTNSSNKFTFLQDLIQNPPPVYASDTVMGHSHENMSAMVSAEANGISPITQGTTVLSKKKKKYNKSPKNPHYAVKGTRLNSFQGWPASDIISPTLLAECGFYYAGLEDCVRCFHCGIGLRHWAVEDDPWIEHSRWTLENPCYFLIQMKGEEYVDLVRMAVEITDNQPTQSDEAPQSEQPNSKEESSKGSGQAVVTSASSSTRGSSSIQSNNSESSSVSSENKSGSSSGKGNLSEQKQLKLENEKLRKQTYCTICCERNVCVVFLPCGHLVTCDHCAPSLRICPTCKKGIKGTVKTYMS